MTDALRWTLSASIMALVLVWAFGFGEVVQLSEDLQNSFIWIGSVAGSLNSFVDIDTLIVTIQGLIYFEISLVGWKLTIWYILHFAHA